MRVASCKATGEGLIEAFVLDPRLGTECENDLKGGAKANGEVHWASRFKHDYTAWQDLFISCEAMEMLKEPASRRERPDPPPNRIVSDLEQLPSTKHLPPLGPYSSSSKGFSAEAQSPVSHSTKNIETPDHPPVSLNEVRDVPSSITTRGEHGNKNEPGLLAEKRSSNSFYEGALQSSKAGQTNKTWQDNINLLNGLSISGQNRESRPQLLRSISPPNPSTAKSLRQRFTGSLGSARAVQEASLRTHQSVTKRRFQDGLVRVIEKNCYEAYTEAVHESLEEKWEQSIHNKLHNAVNAVVQGVGLQPQEMFVSLALLMVGPKVGEMLHLLPTIVISCCHKTAKTKIEDLFASNQLDYLCEFECPYLVCFEEREPKRRDRFFADTDSWEVVESSGVVQPYYLSIQRQRYLSFDVERPTGLQSACGLRAEFTYLPPSVGHHEPEGGISTQGCWKARIGGVVQVGGKNFVMTTAHSFLMPSTGGTSDSNIDSTSIADANADGQEDRANVAAKGTRQEPSKGLASGALQGYFAFCGHGRSFDREEQTSLTISNADCCILPMDALSGITNSYRTKDLKGQFVDFTVDKMLDAGEMPKPGVVCVLDSPEKPMESFLTQTTGSIYFGGQSLRVRRIVSQQALPDQLSGCWVVRDHYLLGHIIGGNEFERIMYMIPIQDTKSAIEQITTGSMSLKLASDLNFLDKVGTTLSKDTAVIRQESPIPSEPAKPLPLLPRPSSSTRSTTPLLDQPGSVPHSPRGSRAEHLPLRPETPDLESKSEYSSRVTRKGGSNIWYEDPESGDIYQDRTESNGRTVRSWRKWPKEAIFIYTTLRARMGSVFDHPTDESTSRRQREKSTVRETTRGDTRPSYTQNDRPQPYPEDIARYANDPQEAYYDSSRQASTSYQPRDELEASSPARQFSTAQPRHLSPRPFNPGTRDQLAQSLDALHVSNDINYTHSPNAAFATRDWQPPIVSSRHEDTIFLASDRDPSSPIYSSHDYNDEQVLATSQMQQEEPSRVIKGTPGGSEKIDSSYNVRSGDYETFFRIGRVFSTLWTDALGNTSKVDPTFVSEVIYGERVYSKIRRFIVVREGERCVSCLPVTSYANEGFRKSGISLNEHGFIYSRNKPKKVEGMCSRPLKLLLASGAAHIKDPSLVNYGKVYNVETNVKVKNVGYVDGDSEAILLHYFRRIYSGIVDDFGGASRAPPLNAAVLLGVGAGLDSVPASNMPPSFAASGSAKDPTITGTQPAPLPGYPSFQGEISSDGNYTMEPTDSKAKHIGIPPPPGPMYFSQSAMESAPGQSAGAYFQAPNTYYPQGSSLLSSGYPPPQEPFNPAHGFYQQSFGGYVEPSARYSQPPSGYSSQPPEPAPPSSPTYDDDIDLASDPDREAAIARRRREFKSDRRRRR